MFENSGETDQSIQQPAPQAELCTCKFWGTFTPHAKSCGHIHLGPTFHPGYMVTIEDAELFVERMNEVIHVAKQLRAERLNEVEVAKCVGLVNEMIESIDAQLSESSTVKPVTNREQIWKVACNNWSAEAIARLESHQHELMLKCIQSYGDQAPAKFKEFSEALNQQLAADLLPNPAA